MQDPKELKVAVWLRDQCGVDEAKAVALAQKLDKQNMIRSVTAFKELLLRVPNALDALHIPAALQPFLREKLTVCANQPLHSLSTHSIYALMKSVYPAKPFYADCMLEGKVSGYVLNNIHGGHQLQTLGKMDKDEAEGLLKRLTVWKLGGVPPDLLNTPEQPQSYNGGYETPAQVADDEGGAPGDYHLVENTTSPFTPATKKRRFSHSREPPANSPDAGAATIGASERTMSVAWVTELQERLTDSTDLKEALLALATIHSSVGKDLGQWDEATTLHVLKAVLAGAHVHTTAAREQPPVKVVKGQDGGAVDHSRIVELCVTVIDAVLQQRTDPAKRRRLLLEGKLLTFLLQHTRSRTQKVRLVAVEALKKLLETECAEVLLTETCASDLKSSYFSCLHEAPTTLALDKVRHLFSQVIEGLSRTLHKPPQQHLASATLLMPQVLPVLADMLRHDTNGRTIFPRAAMCTLQLLRAVPQDAAQLVRDWELAAVLIGRLEDTHVGVLQSAWECLTDLAGLLGEAEVALLQPALGPLHTQLTAADSATPLATLARFVTAFLSLGSPALDVLLHDYLAIWQVLVGHLSTASVQDAAGTAEVVGAVLQAAEVAHDEYLEALLEHDLYAALFLVLAALPPPQDDHCAALVVHALELLHRLVQSVDQIDMALPCAETATIRWGHVNTLSKAAGRKGEDPGSGAGVPKAVVTAAKRLLVAKVVANN